METPVLQYRIFARNVLSPPMRLVSATLLVLAAAVNAQPAPTEDMRNSQAHACFDTVWKRSEFGAVPKAGLAVMYGGFTPQNTWVYWIVDWRDLRAAGTCWLPPDQAVVREVETFCSRTPGGGTPQ